MSRRKTLALMAVLKCEASALQSRDQLLLDQILRSPTGCVLPFQRCPSGTLASTAMPSRSPDAACRHETCDEDEIAEFTTGTNEDVAGMSRPCGKIGSMAGPLRATAIMSVIMVAPGTAVCGCRIDVLGAT